MNKSIISLPVLPLKDVVFIPETVGPLIVGREKSKAAIEEVMKAKNPNIVLLAQKSSANQEPQPKDLYNIGVTAKIIQMVKLPEDKIKILVEAKTKFIAKDIFERDRHLEAVGTLASFAYDETEESRCQALARTALKLFEEYVIYHPTINADIYEVVSSHKDMILIVENIAANVALKVTDKQDLIESNSIIEFSEKLIKLLKKEIDILNTQKELESMVDDQMKQRHTEFFLNEQMKAIHEKLGESSDGKAELKELEENLKKLNLSDEARKKTDADLKKLKLMSPLSQEASIMRTYLECISSLPWKKYSENKNSLIDAEDVLNKDHYALDKVKERIIEYLAVQKRVKETQGQIICFHGPPGVGKTSLAKSIAKATNREFVRISLGGMKDEAEIRGHRRTYIGALPGRIINAMKKAGTSNPVILLDEIDKIGMDYRGDPAAALLEVLDPEQNKNFLDHYLEIEYDLSKVMFIATANSLDIPRPLLDRLEVINLSGYIEDEKLQIAKRHLLPKVAKENGLSKDEFEINDKALTEIIRYYSMESGVRELYRVLSKISRKIVKTLEEDKIKKQKKQTNIVKVNLKNVEKYLGVRKYQYGVMETENLIGVSTGLAYTDFGGDILSIESVLVPGSGEIKSTGKLGEVMQESTQAAFSFFKSRMHHFDLDSDTIQKYNIHLHVPEGATPKDGPSAGVAIFTAIVSLFTNNPIKRNVAMTGEITLKGRVLAIGGLKEKLMAAKRSGIDTVIIPEENIKDLKEIPNNIKDGIQVYPVKFANEALKIALLNECNYSNLHKIDTNKVFFEKNTAETALTH